jgi:hypothetical protein
MPLAAYVGVAYSISRITFLEFGEMKRWDCERRYQAG